jgi:hypothetical protein
MIHETSPEFSVMCDEPGCYETGPEESTERAARRCVLDPDMGWGEVEGKIYCERHIKKAKSMAKKAAVDR